MGAVVEFPTKKSILAREKIKGYVEEQKIKRNWFKQIRNYIIDSPLSGYVLLGVGILLNIYICGILTYIAFRGV